MICKMANIHKVNYSSISKTLSGLFEDYKTLGHNFVICNNISRYTFTIKTRKIGIDTHMKDYGLISFCAFSHNPNYIYMGSLFKIIDDNVIVDEIELNKMIDNLQKIIKKINKI